MSVKSTIILTSQSEHWYEDVSVILTDKQGNSRNGITLEFSMENITIDTQDGEDLIITVTNPDSDIYKLLSKIKQLA